MSKISIIVPIYNAEKYLSKCIKSIIKQTFKNFELILVNDGSIDRSLEICNKYANKDNRIRVITKKNEGCILTRRRGINEAKSEYITFVDADDWIDEYALEIINEEINKNNSDIIVFNYYRVFKNLTIIKRKNKSFYFEKEKKLYEDGEVKEDLVTAYFHGHPFPANLWGKVYKKECLNIENKYIKNIKFLGEDLYMNMEILLNVEKVSLINEYLYFYRCGGYTNKYMPYFFNDIIEGYKSQKQVIEDYYSGQHYGGISIMLLNTVRTVLYNLFLSNMSEKERRDKILEFVNETSLIEATNNESSKKFFEEEYLNAINSKNVSYLYNIGRDKYQSTRLKRMIQSIL